jgi:cyclopropane fatty-acyl-phospholipid synthase-like methyltransferase
MDELFYELFEGMPRLGPGTDEATLKALKEIPMNGEKKVLDIGCGTGAQTFVLANNLEGQVIALDNYQPFLDEIEERALQSPPKASIKTICMDMKNMVCKQGSLDLVWSEGSIYIMGFSKGLETVYPLMKPGAFVVFSDMNYLKPDPPAELAEFLRNEIPDMISLEENIELIRQSPFELIHHFRLDKGAHWLTYYQPLQNRVVEYTAKYNDYSAAREIADAIQSEIDMYRKYSDFYGYVFYIMQKK